MSRTESRKGREREREREGFILDDSFGMIFGRTANSTPRSLRLSFVDDSTIHPDDERWRTTLHLSPDAMLGA